MFGPVSKILWPKRYIVDQDYLVPVENAPLLSRTGEMNIIIDTGLGNKLAEKLHKIYQITLPWDFLGHLAGRSRIEMVASLGDLGKAMPVYAFSRSDAV